VRGGEAMTRAVMSSRIIDPIKRRPAIRGQANDNAMRVFRAVRNTLPFPVKCILTGEVVPAKSGFAVLFADAQPEWRVVCESAYFAAGGSIDDEA